MPSFDYVIDMNFLRRFFALGRLKWSGNGIWKWETRVSRKFCVCVSLDSVLCHSTLENELALADKKYSGNALGYSGNHGGIQETLWQVHSSLLAANITMHYYARPPPA